MAKTPKRKRYFTFMVVPHDPASRTISIKIPAFVVYLTAVLAVFSVLIVGSSLAYSALLTRRLADYCQTLAKNQEQQAVIDNFAEETRKVNRALLELVQQENKLRKLLGLKGWNSRIRLATDFTRFKDKNAGISENLKNADIELAERRRSLEELKGWVSTVRRRYSATPSRWPIIGRIVSRFGYRVYPWRGFHTGLDISGRYGSPIRSTADGTVAFVGWRQGYGRTVIIKHGYGISTLYAHLSKYAVKRGQRVSKGQIICYVGNTGYVTGPHLHYEVRKWDRAVNPVAYLDLNILTASRTWRQ